MSTSDAGELELRLGGGERATPPYGTTRTPRTDRAQKDANLGEKQTSCHNDETPSDQQRHRPGIRWEETHKARTLRVEGLKKDETSHFNNSDSQKCQTSELKFTSSLFLRLSTNFGFDRIDEKIATASDTCQQSAIQPQHSKDSSIQVNGATSQCHTSIEKPSVLTLSEAGKFPAQKEGETTSVHSNEQDLSGSHSISNCGLGPQKRQKLNKHSITPHPGTDAESLTPEVKSQKDTKEHKKLEAGLEGLSEPCERMLSSTVVSVLAPHWSGRIRRPKKTDASGSSDTQGNFESSHESMSAGGSQQQVRASFLGPRSHTVGWSNKSDPPAIDSNRRLTQTVSLDVNSGKMDTEKTGAGAIGPLSTTALQNDQSRNPQTANQGRLSALSSKPTTSSLLLSLRRFNYNRNPNAASTLSATNPPSQSSDPNGKQFAMYSSQSFLSKKEQERPKPLLSPSSPSYGTTETRHILSPSPTHQREQNKSDKSLFFPTSPLNKEADRTLKSNFTPSAQTFLNKRPLEREQSSRITDKSANTLSETSTRPRHPSFEHASLQKAPSVPRANLTSTSWWKQVTQDSSASVTRTDKPNTPLTPPSHDNHKRATSSPTENKRSGEQIPNNRRNNNTTESLFKSNTNRVLNPQGGDLKQSTAENVASHKLEGEVKQQYGSNLNKQPQRSCSVSDVFFTPKYSRTPAQVSHLRDPSKNDASSTYFTAAEFPPTLANLRSSNTPTENSSEYNNNHWPSRSDSLPTSHMDAQQFTKASRSPDFTSPTLSSHASPTNSSLSPASNAKSSFPFHPSPSHTNIQPPSSAASSNQTPKFTDRHTTTPLGFERNYASIPKTVQPKTVSNLLPTPFSKTNYNPTSNTSSPSFLSPPVTPANTISSLLTPPPTPGVINSSTSSPKVSRTFTSSLEREPKKKRVEGKRVRRVTFDPSVDLQSSDFSNVEKQDASPDANNPMSIFSFLRSGSPTAATTTSSVQAGKGGKFRSLSSDSADLVSQEREKGKQRNGDSLNFDQETLASTTPRQERTLSVESGTAQCRSTAPLSLPPDFSRSYKLRYSSPPYSTLMSSRLAHGETKPIMPRSPLFPQAPQQQYTLNLKTDIAATKNISSSKPAVSPTRALQSLSAQKQTMTKSGVFEMDQVNNNHDKNSPLIFINNRVNFGSQSLQGDKMHDSSSQYVTETLIYSIKPKVDVAPAAIKNPTHQPLQNITNISDSLGTNLSHQSHAVRSREPPSKSGHHSDQSSSGSSSTDSQTHVGMRSRIKESMLGKSRFLSVDVGNEQSPKKSRFALKKSISTPNASLTRSDSEKGNKSTNKMDQVLNKLRQTFTAKWSDDDPSFHFKWRRNSQTPSVSGSSDLGNVSDVSVGSTKTLEEQVEEKRLNDFKKNKEDAERLTQNRYTLIQSSNAGKPAADQSSSWSEKVTPQKELHIPTEDQNEIDSQVQLRVHSPTVHHFDVCKGSADFKATNQLLPCRDPSPCRSPNSAGAYQYRKSTSSPRSPFSPFASLSPVSPFSTPDQTDDVFYSPKLQRRNESPSPCEPVEGISLRGSRKSRASTGPPSIGPGPDSDQMASSYADLKYGIEPGRSFSVSSVLTSRPSGPGRISTGSRFMSVGDLSQSALSCGGNTTAADRWSVAPDRTSECRGQSTVDGQKWYFPSDSGQYRSRSLPRSLTRCLANWSSEVSDPRALNTAASKPSRPRSPEVNICHFPWDAEGPPTPPPTPPLSPVSRRMSKPPSLSSSSSPGTSGSLQGDGQMSRHLPSRGYTSSLSTFDESSDSSSDTTTDGDYYLESDDDDDKETEL